MCSQNCICFFGGKLQSDFFLIVIEADDILKQPFSIIYIFQNLEGCQQKVFQFNPFLSWNNQVMWQTLVLISSTHPSSVTGRWPPYFLPLARAHLESFLPLFFVSAAIASLCGPTSRRGSLAVAGFGLQCVSSAVLPGSLCWSNVWTASRSGATLAPGVGRSWRFSLPLQAVVWSLLFSLSLSSP